MFEPKSEKSIVVTSFPLNGASNQPSKVWSAFVAGSKVIGKLSSALNVAGFDSSFVPPFRL